jgi:predicted ribosomally synthesized peptide with nif11-like leader
MLQSHRRIAMSQADAKSFVERALEDDNLRRQVMDELRHLAEGTPRRLIELGASHGLSFTDAELTEAMAAASQGSAVGELSDSDLDAVAGGNVLASSVYAAWFTCLKSCADSKGQVQGELARFR